ncbi:amidohydrolase [Rhodococcus globerulus]|uniref:Amidohydrolase n=1 Tax=Rhodococcus globerulus TaxID=33008 RepID=A0ABU4C3L6_RHOGO|nr:amidohydrolase [Rhodococcus globerulus]MDV6270803.1 amidohydrolase [Rhodococcus globerulus]
MGSIAFRNGTVWRGRDLADTDRLLVVDGHIQPWRGDRGVEHTVDLEGGFLAPGFGDGHAHPILAGLEQNGPQIRGARSVPEIVETVGEWARAHPGDDWIVAASYDATLTPSGLFDAQWLDAAVPDRPVLLRSWDYHSVWCNTRALELAGIDRDTPQPKLGQIPRRADGEAMGTLFEWGAVTLAMQAAPPFSLEAGVAALDFATHHLAAQGVTWIQDAWVDPDDIEIWLAAEQQGVLACRADLALRADPLRWAEQRTQLAAQRARIEATQSLTCRTIKFFVDGIVENHTAHLLHEYSDACTRGMEVWKQDQLLAAAAYVDALGFELHMHTTGDAGARSALDAVEHIIAVNGPRNRRPVIAHAQLVDDADLPRFAELGVIACFQPLWATNDDVMQVLTLPRLGIERGHRQYRIRTLMQSGAPLSFGSDWPVTSADVLAGLQTAVTRARSDGTPLGGWMPEERIDITAALDVVTRGVAYQAGAETRRGQLGDGYEADLVWLSADPRKLPADKLTSVKVLGTWVAGTPTYQFPAGVSTTPADA